MAKINKNIKSLIIISIFIILILIVKNNMFFENTNNTEIKKLIETVELADHQLSNLKITYDEYLDKLDNLFYNQFEKESHNERFYGSNVKNIENINTDFLLNNESEFSKNVKVSISEVYDCGWTTNENWKWVYTKSNLTFKDEDNENIISNKRYTLKNNDNIWQIVSIDFEIYLQSALNEDNTSDILNYNEKAYEPKYDIHENEKIKYLYTFYPLKE